MLYKTALPLRFGEYNFCRFVKNVVRKPLLSLHFKIILHYNKWRSGQTPVPSKFMAPTPNF